MCAAIKDSHNPVGGPRLSDTLRSRRSDLGVRPEALAGALGIAGSSLRNYENGTTRPALDPETLSKYMALLGVSFEEFLMLCRNTKSK